MPDLGEASPLRDVIGPALDGFPLDLNAAATTPAGQVVMVGVGLAAPVERLPGRVPDRVDPPGLAEHLQMPVHGREPDGLARGEQLGVNLLRAAEPGQPV